MAQGWSGEGGIGGGGGGSSSSVGVGGGGGGGGGGGERPVTEWRRPSCERWPSLGSDRRPSWVGHRQPSWQDQPLATDSDTRALSTPILVRACWVGDGGGGGGAGRGGGGEGAIAGGGGGDRCGGCCGGNGATIAGDLDLARERLQATLIAGDPELAPPTPTWTIAGDHDLALELFVPDDECICFPPSLATTRTALAAAPFSTFAALKAELTGPAEQAALWLPAQNTHTDDPPAADPATPAVGVATGAKAVRADQSPPSVWESVLPVGQENLSGTGRDWFEQDGRAGGQASATPQSQAESMWVSEHRQATSAVRVVASESEHRQAGSGGLPGPDTLGTLFQVCRAVRAEAAAFLLSSRGPARRLAAALASSGPGPAADDSGDVDGRAAVARLLWHLQVSLSLSSSLSLCRSFSRTHSLLHRLLCWTCTFVCMSVCVCARVWGGGFEGLL